MFKASCSSTTPAISFRAALPNLRQVAAASGLIVRQTSKFSAEGFLLTLFKAVSTGRASFNQMAGCLGCQEPKTLSRQALHQRMKPAAIGFLKSVLQQAGSSALMAGRSTGELPFRRILVEDSTQFRMHPKNHPAFRAVANNSGPTAGAKVDVIGGELLRHHETEGHVQDRSLGPELLSMVEQGDLILRDMGYFDVAAFAHIEVKEAFWLSRLHGQASATSIEGRALETLLAKAPGDLLELEVTLTQKEHRARLVAFRSSPEVASRRRQEKKDKRRRNGTQASKKSLAREDWTILVTNIAEAQCSARELYRLYWQRWEIEIHFRAWKQSLNMRMALHRITSRVHLHALILAAMIFSVLASRIKRWLVGQKSKSLWSVSGEKLFIWLSDSLNRIGNLSAELHPDPRHISRCKRKRRSLIQNGSGFRP